MANKFVVILLLSILLFVGTQNVVGNEQQLRQQVREKVAQAQNKKKPTPYPTKATPYPTGTTSKGFLNTFAMYYHNARPLPAIGQCPKPAKPGVGYPEYTTADNGECYINPALQPEDDKKSITSIDGFPTFVAYQDSCADQGKIHFFATSQSCNVTEETPYDVDSLCLSSGLFDMVICCGEKCWGEESVTN